MCTKCNNTGTFKKKARHNYFMPTYAQDKFDYFYCDCDCGVALRDAAAQVARDEELAAQVARDEELAAQVARESKRAIEMMSDLSLGATKVVLRKEKTAYTPYGMQDTFIGDNDKKYRTIKFNIPEGVPIVIVAKRGFIKDFAILSSSEI